MSTPPPVEPIACRADAGFLQWLMAANGSLAISTYQAGKVLFVSAIGEQLSLLPRHFDKPMGMTFAGRRAALATKHDVTLFADAPLLAPDYLPDRPNAYDALYLPRATYHTGDLNVHDVAFGEEGLWLVATRFSCLASLSKDVNFVPRWRPKFVSETVPEDRCHLNGLALVDGHPKFVTALGTTDEPGAWRANKATGGILMDVPSNEVIVQGLSMPHSPRWYGQRLWALNSGAGELVTIDLATGRAITVTALPAYLRGMSFSGEFAIIGLCQIREKHIFGSLPVQQKHAQLLCGVAIIHLPTGKQVGLLEFTAGCQEIFEVQFLSGIRRPNLLQYDRPDARQAFTAPGFSYWLRPQNEVPLPVKD